MAWEDHAKIALKSFVELSTGMTPSESQWSDFCSYLRPKKFEKGAVFAEQDEKCDSIGFVYKGIFVFSVSDSEGVEKIKSFNGENGFVAAYTSFINGCPSTFRVSAYEESYVLLIDSKSLRHLFDKEMIWQKLGRLNAEQAYIRKETRESELLILDAEERYQSFMNSHESVADRIAGKDVASYLGINPATLSRLRKKLGF